VSQYTINRDGRKAVAAAKLQIFDCYHHHEEDGQRGKDCSKTQCQIGLLEGTRSCFLL
jgi:hypothetical protein